mmetsp:Transcript_33032/g.69524  ORF Transcript_33032/g.69524 Transcript_33032/m.69524 type:complete len:313 (-) Transcript_33032:61-999(-)
MAINKQQQRALSQNNSVSLQSILALLPVTNHASSQKFKSYDRKDKKGRRNNRKYKQRKGGQDDNLYGENTLQRHSFDATITERLTSSPNVINIYAYCAQSTINDYANNTLGKQISYEQKTELGLTTYNRNRKKMRYARDIAKGLADLHNINNKELAMAVYRDLTPKNVVVVNGRVILNDFNDGEMLQRNVTSGSQCFFKRSPRDAKKTERVYYHSPEELHDNKLTEKVDIWALGSTIHFILVGYGPKQMAPGDSTDAIMSGLSINLPSNHTSSDSMENSLVEVINKCYRFDPKDRPHARDIVRDLDEILRES